MQCAREHKGLTQKSHIVLAPWHRLSLDTGLLQTIENPLISRLRKKRDNAVGNCSPNTRCFDYLLCARAAYCVEGLEFLRDYAGNMDADMTNAEGVEKSIESRLGRCSNSVKQTCRRLNPETLNLP